MPQHSCIEARGQTWGVGPPPPTLIQFVSWAREMMVQKLRALAALTENLGSISSIHT